MKKFITFISILILIFVFIDKATEKLYLTNVEISQEDKKTLRLF